MINMFRRSNSTTVLRIIDIILIGLMIISSVYVNISYNKIVEMEATDVTLNISNDATEDFHDANLYLSRKCLQYLESGDIDYLNLYVKEVYETRTREAALLVILGLDINDLETQYINDAFELSNTLIEEDLYAMKLYNIANGVSFDELPEEFQNIVISNADLELDKEDQNNKAHEYVFNDEYDKNVNDVDNLIKQYSSHRNERIISNYDLLKQAALNSINANRIITIVVIVIIVNEMIGMYYMISKPIYEYSNNMTDEQGNLISIEPKGSREFIKFAKVYNEIVDGNNLKTSKLEQEVAIRDILETVSKILVISYDVSSQEYDVTDGSKMIFEEKKLKLNTRGYFKFLNDMVHENNKKKVFKYSKTITEDSIEFRLKNKEGNYIWVRSLRKALYKNGELIKLNAFIQNIDEHKREAEKLIKLSQIDQRTGVLNNMTAISKIDDYISHEGKNGKHALYIMDVDKFKSINDVLGHQAGDDTLETIAKNLTEFFDSDDIIGRLGGDEFMVFEKNVDNIDSIKEKLFKLNKLLNFKETNGEKEITVTISIGAAIYNSDNQTHFENLYTIADKNLYLAKLDGRNNFHLTE